WSPGRAGGPRGGARLGRSLIGPPRWSVQHLASPPLDSAHERGRNERDGERLPARGSRGAAVALISGPVLGSEGGRVTTGGDVKDGLNPCVLVADDDREMCDVIRAILDQAGVRTVGARDGDEAVAIAAARQPAGIVMDVLMPRMDGYTALTRLRGDARTRAIPVVMLTAQPDQIYQSLSAGVGGGRPSDEALHRAAIDSAGRGSDA